jgi:hypothetical protein
MTIVDVALVAFVVLIFCAFWVTADREVADDLGQHERDCAPDRARARDNGGREFSPEAHGNFGSRRSA